jgi:hypothetical protein
MLTPNGSMMKIFVESGCIVETCSRKPGMGTKLTISSFSLSHPGMSFPFDNYLLELVSPSLYLKRYVVLALALYTV